MYLRATVGWCDDHLWTPLNPEPESGRRHWLSGLQRQCPTQFSVRILTKILKIHTEESQNPEEKTSKFLRKFLRAANKSSSYSGGSTSSSFTRRDDARRRSSAISTFLYVVLPAARSSVLSNNNEGNDKNSLPLAPPNALAGQSVHMQMVLRGLWEQQF